MRRLTIVGPRGARWQVDAPTTRWERTRGLRGRALGTHQAMLLERCRSVHTIAMAIPITVAFLDAASRVTRVERAPTGRILFCRDARHVLECHIAADVQVGDLLSRRAAPGEPASPMLLAPAVRRERDGQDPVHTPLYSGGCPSSGR